MKDTAPTVDRDAIFVEDAHIRLTIDMEVS
jgi:hypothetical protein